MTGPLPIIVPSPELESQAIKLDFDESLDIYYTK